MADGGCRSNVLGYHHVTVALRVVRLLHGANANLTPKMCMHLHCAVLM